MTNDIRTHEGVKYLRPITARVPGGEVIVPEGEPPENGLLTVMVDVYAVLRAFPTGGPETDHAAKKLLMCGQRRKGDRLADLLGVQAAVTQAILAERIERAKQAERDKGGRSFGSGKMLRPDDEPKVEFVDVRHRADETGGTKPDLQVMSIPIEDATDASGLFGHTDPLVAAMTDRIEKLILDGDDHGGNDGPTPEAAHVPVGDESADAGGRGGPGVGVRGPQGGAGPGSGDGQADGAAPADADHPTIASIAADPPWRRPAVVTVGGQGTEDV